MIDKQDVQCMESTVEHQHGRLVLLATSRFKYLDIHDLFVKTRSISKLEIEVHQLVQKEEACRSVV